MSYGSGSGSSDKNRGREAEEEQQQPVFRRSVEVEPATLTENGSLTAQELSIDDCLLVDPKLLFIGSKIGEGAHGKVYEGRSVFSTCVFVYIQLWNASSMMNQSFI